MTARSASGASVGVRWPTPGSTVSVVAGRAGAEVPNRWRARSATSRGTSVSSAPQTRSNLLFKGADYTVDQVVGGDIVRANGGTVAGVAMVVDRSNGATKLGVPMFSLLEGGYSRELPELILAYLKGVDGK